MWVYLSVANEGFFTVGFYDPAGKWHPESDHEEREKAAARCAWLNGARREFEPTPIRKPRGNDDDDFA
jgi:hypothetical protein